MRADGLGPPASARPGSSCSAARAARSRDADRGAIDALRADLDAFAGELALDELPDALLAGGRRAAGQPPQHRSHALDVVADAQPVQVPAPALAAAHPSARSRLKAALISARWVNACGKLPSCSPVGPISSE